MLVLTRKLGEAVCIGGARVVILGLSKRTVKLGIEAPPSMPVLREELVLARREKSP
jgi:carbon storage regulator CsrA